MDTRLKAVLMGSSLALLFLILILIKPDVHGIGMILAIVANSPGVLIALGLVAESDVLFVMITYVVQAAMFSAICWSMLKAKDPKKSD